jgi:two-component system chemotaxis response regulator CheY
MTRILVVEDDRNYRELAETLLAEHEVISAGTLSEANAALRGSVPEMIFLDIALPDGSGLTLLEAVHTVHPDIFVVMLTGSSQKDDVERAIKNGAKGYIIKPLSRQKIKEYMDKYEAFCKIRVKRRTS